MKVIVQKSAQVGRTVRRVRHNLHPIAGGDHHGLFNPGIRRELAANVGQARFGDRQPLADFERSALVIQTDELVSHMASVVLMRRRTYGSVEK